MSTLATENALTLEKEIKWLTTVINARVEELLNEGEPTPTDLNKIPPPQVGDSNSTYARLVRDNHMSSQERIILILSLMPHIQPEGLDTFFLKNTIYDRVHTEFGGLKGNFHSGFLPTGETAAFLIAYRNLYARIELIELFERDHFFYKKNILKLGLRQEGEPLLSSKIEISAEYLTLLTSGKPYKPDFSASFPANRLSTPLDWTDLVLDPVVLAEISELSSWIEHQDTIMNDWGLSKQLKPGYRGLFYGPPGTGKTLTACLLGKSLNLDVYRVDLSQVVSKYIGETEKNMANIFDQAEYKNWILFFDEADALFGKRTATSDSKDRHANQEIAYLLQRVESFAGIVILATNLKANMDNAFTRRFQSIIYFPTPNFEQRYKLWKNAFSPQLNISEDVDFENLAYEFEVTGGNIINVLRYCSLMALRRDGVIRMDDIREGVRKELKKEGKTL